MVSSVIKAEPHHAAWLASHLCPEDLVELEALGVEPVHGLTRSIEVSDPAFAIFIGDEIAALLGVVRRDWGGQFWLLTGTAVRRSPIAFIRAAKPVFAEISSPYLLMANIVDARHDQALRLAKHFGFELSPDNDGEPEPLGVHGELFHTIRWEAPNVHRA
jgi:hypothetical protein